MKTKLKNAFKIMLAVLVVSCSNDDNPDLEPVELGPVEIQFGVDTFYLENTQDNDITILFDQPAFVAGTITINVISNAPLFFNTFPAAINNEISVPVEKGAESATFKFNPRDDWFIDGHKLVTFELKTVSQGFTIGTKNDLLVDIFDDELRWKPLSYETKAGENRTKRTYEYMQDGKLNKVQLETVISQETTTITYTYYYDAHSKLQRIENSNGNIEWFTWENGKIVQSDYIVNGVKIFYKHYQYNNEGKINLVGMYERNPDNNYFSYTTVEIYDYSNANLNKKVVHRADGPLNWIIASTETYDSYFEKENPFQMNEILPLNISQPHLPLSLRIEENGGNVLLNYSYEYNSAGLPVKRTTTGEVTTFSYY